MIEAAAIHGHLLGKLKKTIQSGWELSNLRGLNDLAMSRSNLSWLLRLSVHIYS